MEKEITMTLFISYTWLLYALKTQKVQPEELATSLFFFGCTRDLVLENAMSTQDPYAHLIAAATKRAMDEGRCVFRKPQDTTNDGTWRRLEKLLQTNFIELPPDWRDRIQDRWPSYPAIAEVLADQLTVKGAS